MILGEKIKFMRKKFGFTQEELAEKLNVSRQAIAKWEMGSGIPDTENLKTISKLFSTSIDVLLDNESDMPLTVLHQKINLKEFGKSRGEQYLNVLNKNFDKSWKIYVLTFNNKLFSIETVLDIMTFKLASINQLLDAFKEVNYLAVKEQSKLFITIGKEYMDIKSLGSNTNIKKFDLDKRTYYNISELKRD